MRLLKALSAPYEIEGQEIEIGTSIGIALAPNDSVNGSELLKYADLAMYKVKAEGRNGYRFFNPELDAEARTRHALGHDLREALSRGQFELHYQPLVNLGTEEVVGFEALLRWRHPERGLVLPDEFIVHAEETGLIGPIGEWVLREACSAACKWPDHIRISVNLSSVQFRIRSVATFRCTIGAVFYAAILCFPTSWGCLAQSTSSFEVISGQS